MDDRRLEPYFLPVFVGGAMLLAFFIFKPFLPTLILALVFSVIFRKPHRTISKWLGNWESLAAFLTALLIIVIILVPIVLLGVQVFNEAGQLYSSLTSGEGKATVFHVFQSIIHRIQSINPRIAEINIDVDQYVRQALDLTINSLGALLSNFTSILASTFVFLVALYYLLKDGDKLREKVMEISPLAKDNDEAILKKLELAVNSVVKGSLLIALLQGIVAAGGFLIFGVPNAVLWGTLAAIAALIPNVGTALIIAPAVLYLFLSGNIGNAVGLTIWGTLAVGLIDNFLGPKLVGRGMQLHPLIIFLSVLGGLMVFGPLGFLLGPLTMSLLFALLDIYSAFVSRKKA